MGMKHRKGAAIKAKKNAESADDSRAQQDERRIRQWLAALGQNHFTARLQP